MSSVPTETGALCDTSLRRVVMRQTWERLLFLHWRIDPQCVQSRLPEGLCVETFDGAAWIGIVPFLMRNVRFAGWPAIPTARNFLELNLRTYVRHPSGGTGVWFFSLDASSRLAVIGARRWFSLPYWRAKMSAVIDHARNQVDYSSRRCGAPASTASEFSYAPAGELRSASPGTLEHFLIERYRLFARLRNGAIATGEVRHPPYQFADARLLRWDGRLLGLSGLPIPEDPPEHAVVSPGVDVDVFPLQRPGSTHLANPERGSPRRDRS